LTSPGLAVAHSNSAGALARRVPTVCKVESEQYVLGVFVASLKGHSLCLMWHRLNDEVGTNTKSKDYFVVPTVCNACKVKICNTCMVALKAMLDAFTLVISTLGGTCARAAWRPRSCAAMGAGMLISAARDSCNDERSNKKALEAAKL
jgi:hypothetical protein